MTSKNKPKVKIVSGKVNKIKMGFTSTLSKTNTIATQKDCRKSSTLMPGSKFDKSKTKAAVISNLISIEIFYILQIILNFWKPTLSSFKKNSMMVVIINIETSKCIFRIGLFTFLMTFLNTFFWIFKLFIVLQKRFFVVNF